MTNDQPLELWGGLECTVARVGDDYRDQSRETGHHDRIEDLDRIAGLGIRRLRYPALWETISPDPAREPDWSWHDARFARLRSLSIDPIAGLVHHGSGPRHTSLVDPAFPELLAGHAEAVARRYPWVEWYTPVNEPLTTARFSGLYGHWYPHGRDFATFARALVIECKATLLAMRAVRRVNPAAKLVQTDDMGKTFSTPALAYQAAHENDRRWLSFDLLCGRVDREHPFWSALLRAGVPEADLALLREGDGAPDIIGINHYLTSERYLDERTHLYPEHHLGGNGFQRYADAEAVRVELPPQDIGPAARLRETWARYRRPLAVTEVHHGCSRDEQLRWFLEVWNAARTVKAEGADIRGVTVWALFGAVDWNTLLTERRGFYEPGPYDVRGPEPRPTVLAAAAEGLAKHGAFDHPVLDRGGWWRRVERFYRRTPHTQGSCRLADEPRRVLITGASGTLGRGLSRIAEHRGLDHVLLSRAEMDIADPASVAAALERHRPWAVVNAAGYVRVADAERESEACLRANRDGPAILARACAGAGIPLVTFSSDLVFDGGLGRPPLESDEPAPTGVYGRSKAEAEALVLAAHPGALVVRTSAFFGPWDRHNFVWRTLDALARGETVTASPDLVTPTYVPDLAHAALDLLIDGERGIRHLANPGAISWAELARRAARRAGLPPRIREEAREPRITALGSERGVLMPTLESAMERFFFDCEIPWERADGRMAAE